MYRPRIIPVLLLKDRSLVKTVKFRKPLYLGDPINAVKLFNDMKADELVFLDITASKHGRCIDIDYVMEIAEEANMPFSVGGGITTLDQAELLLKNGSEKVIINTSAFYNPKVLTEIASHFGTQSLVVSVDVAPTRSGNYAVFVCNGTRKVAVSFIDYCHKVINYGAGELLIQSIDRDGLLNGYDLAIAVIASQSFPIPISICGGARSMDDMIELSECSHIQGLAAGSMFVFQGVRGSFLINYPDAREKEKLRRINGV